VGTATPLQGLRIALEAGHGGPTNLGALGATATPEKDFNRWTTDALAAELLAAGAVVIDIRAGDTNPTLRERTRRAESEGAQLYVSVHANAADPAGGHLRVSGASTYYKHSPSMPLAAAVHRRVLAATGLPDFGLVGNFNYAPLRWLTAMPALLVEQAFVTHPGDEARLLDPAFRNALARAVRLGIEDALRA
jgi:N-acetylmuramoyl-L-alanine amidase